jgi:hypothetical protein
MSPDRLPWTLGAISLLAACAKAPPPVAPVEPPPARPPTLSVAYDYTPSLVILLRLDGKPVAGEIELSAAAEAPDPSTPPEGSTSFREKLEAREGKLSFTADQLRELSRLPWRVVHIPAAQIEIPLPKLGSSDPFLCALALDNASGEDSCQNPPLSPPPSECDSQGSAAWKTIEDHRQQAFDECWSGPPDEPRLARLKEVGHPSVRRLVCQSLLAAIAGPLGDAIESSLYAQCAPHMSFEQQNKYRPSWRRETLASALERARTRSSAEMQSFYQDYLPTQDSRVETIRTTAVQRFGPPDVPAFRALQKRIAALKTPQGHHAQLCELTATTADYALLSPPPRPIPQKIRITVATNGLSRPYPRQYAQVPPVPAYFVKQIEALLKQAGARELRTPTACPATRYWYLATPLPAAAP